MSLESNYSNNSPSQQYELNSKMIILSLTLSSDVVNSTMFFLSVCHLCQSRDSRETHPAQYTGAIEISLTTLSGPFPYLEALPVP